jgi:hypothetical protein
LFQAEQLLSDLTADERLKLFQDFGYKPDAPEVVAEEEIELSLKSVWFQLVGWDEIGLEPEIIEIVSRAEEKIGELHIEERENFMLRLGFVKTGGHREYSFNQSHSLSDFMEMDSQYSSEDMNSEVGGPRDGDMVFRIGGTEADNVDSAREGP